MKYSIKYNLQPADRIVEPLFQTALSKHHAIFLGEDAYGREWIAENDFNEGVRIIKADDFFNSFRKIERIEKFLGSVPQARLAVKRALALAGKPYNLITYNCEHYANEVQHGKPESKQVQTALWAMAIGVFLIGALNAE